MTRRRWLTLIRPPMPVDPRRTAVVPLIQQHAELVLDWLGQLLDAYQDPTATGQELTEFCEAACAALEARIAALRADLWTGDR